MYIIPYWIWDRELKIWLKYILFHYYTNLNGLGNWWFSIDPNDVVSQKNMFSNIKTTHMLFFFIQNMFIGLVSHSSWCRILLVRLLSDGASFCKPCFSSCRLPEDSTAANTLNYCLCMAKDGGDFIASWAFYIQEIGIRALYQALFLVFPLLLFWKGMKKILCERRVLERRSSPPEKASCALSSKKTCLMDFSFLYYMIHTNHFLKL